MSDCGTRLSTYAGTLLLVDDDVPFRRSLAISLRLDGISVLEAATREEALERLAEAPVTLAMVNQHLAAGQGEVLMEEIARLSPATQIVAVSCQPGLPCAMVSSGRALQMEKPVDPSTLLQLLAR